MFSVPILICLVNKKNTSYIAISFITACYLYDFIERIELRAQNNKKQIQ